MLALRSLPVRASAAVTARLTPGSRSADAGMTTAEYAVGTAVRQCHA